MGMDNVVNKEIFQECIQHYKKVFKDRIAKELFKWRAIKIFQQKWDINATDFGKMFMEATDGTGSLLTSMNYLPRTMINEMAQQDPEAVRSLFIGLFDESKEVAERIIKFQSDAQELCDKLFPEKQHYQRPMAISVYLWLHNPEKYCIYKYTAFRKAAIILKSDFVPGKQNVIRNIQMNQEFTENIRQLIMADSELINMINEELGEDCYSDDNHLTLASDVKFFISTLSDEDEDVEWHAEDYDPGISKEKWKELIQNKEIFTGRSLRIMKRMLDYGGEATCLQLAQKYGGKFEKYNFGSINLARRVAKETGCPPRINKDGKVTLWPVLFTGRSARKDEKGVFVWKIRPELKAALEETDLSEVPLYAESEKPFEKDEESIEVNDAINKYTRDDFLEEVYMTGGDYDTLRALLLNKKNVILCGAPGVGKTFAAKRLVYSIMGVKDDSRIEFVQFHQNYSYEDFIMGYKPDKEGFELKYGVFYRFCQKAIMNPDRDYFFIIDEINRGNMSKIFGELLMLIEKDYRGEPMTMAYDGKEFSIPGNLYIIGMMNTADRSLALIDYALRRRFSFFTMEPGFTSEGFQKYLDSFNDDTFNTLISRIIELNTEISRDSD